MPLKNKYQKCSKISERKLLRKRIVQECEKQTLFKGVVELDESYFGLRWIRGKRGQGAGSKTIVFGIFKREYKVYTEIVSY